MSKDCNVSELLGKTIKSIAGMTIESEEVIILCNDGSSYKMHHYQDCCESVSLVDVIGEVSDLVGSPITMAEDISNESEGFDLDRSYDDSHTWTWYKFATVKGYVTLRWLGESNGYYGEEVSFERMDDNE